MIIEQPDENEDTTLRHIGVLHRSGRYPWGSGKDPHQRSKGFLDYVDSMKKQGLSEVQIARGLGMMTEDGKFSTTDLRINKTIAKDEVNRAERAMAQMLKAKNMSNVAIGQRMGKNESSVRALLDDSTRAKRDVLLTTRDMLKESLADGGYLDIGKGSELHMGVSRGNINTAAAMLKDEGYKVFYLQVEQQATGKNTNTMVLAPPGKSYSDLLKERDQVKSPAKYSEDLGHSFKDILPPVSVNSKRIGVRWAEDGGTDKDGVIELRRNVEDLSLGAARYAQVRIAVDGTHYLKGMAMYSDHMPDGVDIMFNTNKSYADAGGDKLKAFKGLKEDNELPFGSVVRQKFYTGKDGKQHQSPLNIVGTEKANGQSTSGEEGGWHEWSRTLSSQMLSKQTPEFAKQQLGLTYDIKKSEFDEIMSLTNPAIKRKLLKEFSDNADASAVKLKAAGLPRTRAQVLLPLPSMKETEIYAPNFKNGETVVLIRHPHGGIFEIPELKVNNKNAEGNRLIPNAKDAVGIHPKVAERLSGADFDGDTVLVIPNPHGKIKTSQPLAQLKNFDPKIDYKGYEGMPEFKGKQKKMGDVSNLITDMTIKGASTAEIARAVKHSMVVIDAEKHGLDWKQSELDQGIAELKTKYQGGPRKGASTLISQAKSDIRVPEFKLRSASKGGNIDPATGKFVKEQTGNTYTDKMGRVKESTSKISKMASVEDAHSLSSGTRMESIYADHANKLKSLANQARKAMVETQSTPYSATAAKTYAPQVQSLRSKLNLALRNAPLERQAQIIAKTQVSARKAANPDLEKDSLRKIQNMELTKARIRVGASKQQIEITPQEWHAIQAGAISNHMLEQILNNSNMETVKQLATPRDRPVMSDAKISRAKSMLSSGYTQAEIAEALGVPTSTLHDAIDVKGGK